MKTRKHSFKIYGVAIFLMLAQACGDAETTAPVAPDTTGGGGGKEDGVGGGSGFDFGFRAEDPEDYTVRTDHLGISLLATGIPTLDRSDAYSCSSANNQTSLLTIYRGVVELHRGWGDDFRAMGFETCTLGDPEPGELTEEGILDFLLTAPCTTQRFERTLPDGTRLPSKRVIDIITPDFASIDVDEPSGFPNGRLPTDSITDLFFAMGLLDLTKHAPSDLQMNPPANDVPFPTSFPWLAPAHTDIPR